MLFTDDELAFLTSQRLGRLATVQANGQPQASPVGFSWNETTSTIDIRGYRMAGTQKFRNLATNDLVAFVVDDVISTDPWTPRCLEIRGRAETLHDTAGEPPPMGDGAVIRIYPTRLVSWGIDASVPTTRNVDG